MANYIMIQEIAKEIVTKVPIKTSWVIIASLSAMLDIKKNNPAQWSLIVTKYGSVLNDLVDE